MKVLPSIIHKSIVKRFLFQFYLVIEFNFVAMNFGKFSFKLLHGRAKVVTYDKQTKI